MPPGHKAGHESVARARTEAGADVAAGGNAVQHDPRGQHRRPKEQTTGRGEHSQGGIDNQPHYDDVAEGAETGTLAQWDPSHQDQRADAVDHPAHLDAQMSGDALVQDVPRIQAQARLYQQGQADPESDQSRIQPRHLEQKGAATPHRDPTSGGRS